MAVLSILRRAYPPIQSLSKSWQLNGTTNQIRNHGKKMYITPSKWSWHQFKDVFHFYVLLGAIPFGTLVFFVNIYIGPAQLKEIPEGYIPENWEYYRHPISRWMARYIYPTHQEEYERFMHVKFVDDERTQMGKIAKNVANLMKTRGDSTAYFYNPPVLDYIKSVREEFENEEREYISMESRP